MKNVAFDFASVKSIWPWKISESVIIPNIYLNPISANFDVWGKNKPVIQHLDFEQSGPFFPNFPN